METADGHQLELGEGGIALVKIMDIETAVAEMHGDGKVEFAGDLDQNLDQIGDRGPRPSATAPGLASRCRRASGCRTAPGRIPRARRRRWAAA